MVEKGRRRGLVSWFVEPYRQVKLGLMFLVVNLVFACAIIGVFGYYLWDVYQAMVVYFQLSADQGEQIIAKLHIPLMAAVSIIIIFIITTILLSVRYTHAIYGPLVSIHRFLDDMVQGRKVQPLVLRESDQLLELARKLNDLNGLIGAERHPNELQTIKEFLDSALKADAPVMALDLGQDPLQRDVADKINTLIKMARKKA